MKGICTFLAFLYLLSFPGQAAAADERCSHRGEPGPCKALIESYHHDPGSGTCKEFYWGGCGAIPFKTKEECLQACSALREARRAAWNRPVLWPFAAGALVLIAFIWPAWRQYRQHEEGRA